jgi:hypothetical protein
MHDDSEPGFERKAFACAICFRTGMESPGLSTVTSSSDDEANVTVAADTTQAPTPAEPYNLQCGHAYCVNCIANWCASATLRLGGPGCPLCRRNISVNDSCALMNWQLIFNAKDIVTHMDDLLTGSD